jgi:hypothetical protein
MVMADILPARIESISDPNSGAQDRPAPKRHAKLSPCLIPVQPPVPKVSSPEEEEKHNLDEMA